MTHYTEAGDEEYALRVHIRQLLLNYTVTHITTDYIQLTEQTVDDLWRQYLMEIPTADPHSLTLPTDPFETLTRLHGLGSIDPFVEKFQSTPSAIQYIKRLIKPQSGKPKSDRIAFQESSFESYVPVCPSLSPMLTSRALRDTPRRGSNKFLKTLPPSCAKFLSSQAIRGVEIEAVHELSVQQDEVLNANWRLDSAEQDAVRSFLRSMFAARPKGRTNRHLDPCLRTDTPPPPNRVPEAPFIPIFPRKRRVASGVREGDPPPSGLKGLVSLPAVILPPVKVEELEPDLHEQNMVIVDEAYRSSPSLTPTPTSSQEDQVDELFMESPNTTPPPIRPSKMEVVQIPRTKRIGGGRKKPAPIGYGSDLGTFLVPLVSRLHTPEPPLRLSPAPDTSMLGQADSTCAPQTDDVRKELDSDIAQLYCHARQDPRDLVLREQVDDKQHLLMEVPILPPPNEHPPNALFLPLALKDFVAPLKVKGQANAGVPTQKFLKKAKGISSLNIELSWMPIAARTRIPTNVEIIKATAFLAADDPSSSDLAAQVVSLLGEVSASISSSDLQTQDTWVRQYGSILHPAVASEDPGLARCEIILSRKERRRAAGPYDEQEDETEASECAMDAGLVQDAYFDDSGFASHDTLEFDRGSPPISSFYGYTDRNPLDFDKENHHPFQGDFADLAHDDEFHPELKFAFPADFRPNENDHDMASAYEQRDFEALPFDSYPAASAQPTQIHPIVAHSDETYAGMFEPHPDAIINDFAVAVTPNVPDIATRSLGITDFAKLRAKKVTIPVPEPHPISGQREANTLPELQPHSIPENIYDQNTLRLPSAWNHPGSLHRYLVSMQLVQKQGLVRSLRSRGCSIDLVERDTVGGVDVVLDPHTAVIYTNLLILPSECAELSTRIAQQSWCYSRLLVVFEAYPASRSYQSKASTSAASELFAYTPPILKALGKLRRDLGISEGCGSKRRACKVQYAFADTVDEAAIFTRHFGDLAEANDESGGIIWGDREWLEDDVPEGEQDLAAADGMNPFAAFLILCQIDLGEFLELDPQVRMERFGVFVGMERMMLLNQVIERRLQALEPSESEMVEMGTA